MTTFKIIRFRQDGESETLVRGLTLDQAQAHCRRDDTHGEGWFDGYAVDDETEDDEADCVRCGQYLTRGDDGIWLDAFGSRYCPEVSGTFHLPETNRPGIMDLTDGLDIE